MELIVYVKQGKKAKKRILKKDIIVSFFSRKELFYILIQDSEDFKYLIFIKKKTFSCRLYILKKPIINSGSTQNKQNSTTRNV